MTASGQQLLQKSQLVKRIFVSPLEILHLFAADLKISEYEIHHRLRDHYLAYEYAVKLVVSLTVFPNAHMSHSLYMKRVRS